LTGINLEDNPELLSISETRAAKLAKRDDSGADMLRFHRIQAHVSLSKNSDQLITIVRWMPTEKIRQVHYEETGEENLFDGASRPTNHSEDLLVRRATLPGSLFRFDQDRMCRDDGELGHIEDREEGLFRVLRRWYREIIGVTPIRPLLVALDAIPGWHER